MCSFLWGGTTIEQEHHTLVASTARFRARHAHGLGACYKCSATPLHNMGLNRHVQNPSKITESQLDTTPYMEHTQGYTAYHCRFDSHVDQSRNVLRLAIQYFPLILSEKMSQCATLFSFVNLAISHTLSHRGREIEKGVTPLLSYKCTPKILPLWNRNNEKKLLYDILHQALHAARIK